MDKSWGKATWYLFHSLAKKIKPEKFKEKKRELWNMIMIICKNLPCPDCREHASELLKTVKVEYILSDVVVLQNFFYTFHNIVNERKGYKILEFEECNKIYEKAILKNIIKNFIYHFSKNTNNTKTLLDDFHRKKAIKTFMQWYRLNEYCFN